MSRYVAFFLSQLVLDCAVRLLKSNIEMHTIRQIFLMMINFAGESFIL